NPRYNRPMIQTATSVVLWCFVLVLGMACGAGLYESRIEVPQWLQASPDGTYRWNREAAVAANVGLRFWVFLSTGPLTLFTLGGLALVWQAPPAVKVWWLVALGATVIERAMTFGYFIPTMIDLTTPGTYEPAVAANKALQWARLS